MIFHDLFNSGPERCPNTLFALAKSRLHKLLILCGNVHLNQVFGSISESWLNVCTSFCVSNCLWKAGTCLLNRTTTCLMPPLCRGIRLGRIVLCRQDVVTILNVVALHFIFPVYLALVQDKVDLMACSQWTYIDSVQLSRNLVLLQL